MPDRTAHLDRLAPPVLPWAWFLFAHAALLTALGTLVADPDVFGEFYYHPRAVGLVHLITLGWISCNIVGSLYHVGPAAMRVRLAAGRSEATAFALVAVGITGMVAHFWLDTYSGMVWAAGTVLAGLALVGWRVLPAFLSRRLPAAVRWHVGLAFLNLLAAGLLGALLGLERLGVVTVPGEVLAGVRAHAHLAALGWALMMVMGVGYRLLPMQLPSAIPEGSGPRSTAWLLQAGLIGLVVGALGGFVWLDTLGALSVLAALAMFGRQLLWMARNRRRPPRDLPRPDPSILLTAHAFLYLAITAALGLFLLWTPPSAQEIRLTFAYGVAGLLGFLGQLIVGVGGRLLPLTGWMRAFVEGGFEPPEVGMHELASRPLQWLVLAGWVLGLPPLLLGLGTGRVEVIRAAAVCLTVAALADGWNRIRIWRRSRAPAPGATV